ncbi:MAG: hypothetical protein HP494_03675 [Nitrospira sp.]|nr:hypothetical protein [Nitrospira sp.]
MTMENGTQAVGRSPRISVKQIVPDRDDNRLEQDQPTDEPPTDRGLLIAHPPSHSRIAEDEGPYHLSRLVPADAPLTLKQVDRLAPFAAPERVMHTLGKTSGLFRLGRHCGEEFTRN